MRNRRSGRHDSEMTHAAGIDLIKLEEVFPQPSDLRVPDFRALADFNIPPHDEWVELSNDQRKKIEDELLSIHSFCRAQGFDILLSELALINNTKTSGTQNHAPHFSSFISVFVDPSHIIAQSYLRSLSAKTTKGVVQTQIIPHPGLYAPDLAFMTAELGKNSNASNPPPSRSPSTTSLAIYAAKQRLRLYTQPEHDVNTQVAIFLRRFLTEFSNNEQSELAIAQFLNARFLIVPIVRPTFESAALISEVENRKQSRGYPGGALLLFLVGKTEKLGLLTQSILWFLAESGMKEAYENINKDEHSNRSILSYQISHTLKHRMGALHVLIERLRDTIDTDKFWGNLSLLEVTTRKAYRFVRLANSIYFAIRLRQGAPFDANMKLAVSEFTVDRPLDLRSLMESIVSDFPIGWHLHRPTLEFKESRTIMLYAFRSPWSRTKHLRMDDEFYEAILYELMHNTVIHGKMNGPSKVLQVQLTTVERRPAVVLANLAVASRYVENNNKKDELWQKWRSAAPSGLTFVAESLSHTGSGSLYICKGYGRDRDHFAAALLLHGLSDPTQSQQR